MNRRWGLVFAVFFAGCSGAEVAELERVKAANEAEIQRLGQIAENLDKARADAARATADQVIVSLWRSDGDPAVRMKTFGSALESARASYAKEGADWKITVTGTGGGPGAMSALHGLASPGLVLTRIEVSATTWSATMRTRNTPEPPASAAVTRPPMPPEGSFPSADATRLRAVIARQEAEIQELERLVGETRNAAAVVAMIAREREAAAKDPERLGRALKAIAPLFSGKTPLLASGTVDVAAAAYTASGAPAPGVTGETFGARKPEGWTLVSFESGKIRLSYETPP
jgi:hypothetical protein